MKRRSKMLVPVGLVTGLVVAAIAVGLLVNSRGSATDSLRRQSTPGSPVLEVAPRHVPEQSLALGILDERIRLAAAVAARAAAHASLTQAVPDVPAPQPAFTRPTVPTPEPAKTAHAPPTTPPFPFAFLGSLALENGKILLYLSRGGQDYTTIPGDIVDGVFRINGMKDDKLSVTYLPTNSEQTVSAAAEAKIPDAPIAINPDSTEAAAALIPSLMAREPPKEFFPAAAPPTISAYGPPKTSLRALVRRRGAQASTVPPGVSGK